MFILTKQKCRFFSLLTGPLAISRPRSRTCPCLGEDVLGLFPPHSRGQASQTCQFGYQCIIVVMEANISLHLFLITLTVNICIYNSKDYFYQEVYKIFGYWCKSPSKETLTAVSFETAVSPQHCCRKEYSVPVNLTRESDQEDRVIGGAAGP